MCAPRDHDRALTRRGMSPSFRAWPIHRGDLDLAAILVSRYSFSSKSLWPHPRPPRPAPTFPEDALFLSSLLTKKSSGLRAYSHNGSMRAVIVGNPLSARSALICVN